VTASEPIEYLIPKGKHISVQEGDWVETGDYIIGRQPGPHDILRDQGRRGACQLTWWTKSRRSTACRA